MKMTEHNQLRSDKPREQCGLFGVFGIPEAAKLIYAGLFSLQHRGQEGAGIVASDGEKIHSTKGMGLLNEVFLERPPSTLPGQVGIGHVRYSTTGSSRLQNVQPIVLECLDGIWALAHNGNLTNAEKLRRSYQEAGAIFQTSTDSEILLHLIADPIVPDRAPAAWNGRLARTRGGVFVPAHDERLRDGGARSATGFARFRSAGWETAMRLRARPAPWSRWARPSCATSCPANWSSWTRRASAAAPSANRSVGPLGQCIFEHVYFARPDSVVFGAERARNASAARPPTGEGTSRGRRYRHPHPGQRKFGGAWFLPGERHPPWTTGSSATTTSAAPSSCRKWNSASTASI